MIVRKIFLHSLIRRFLGYIHTHRIISAAAAALLVILGYWGYAKLTDTSGQTRYVLASVSKGTLITSITGSGQVSASNQIDLKPKVSGDVMYVGATNGQEVAAGTLIAQLDARDAQKAVRDAEVNLQSAKISLEKLQQPADALSLTQAQNALAQAKEDKEKATNDLAKAYDDAFIVISNAFLDLPTMITGVQNVLYKTDYNSSQDNLSYYTDSVRNYDANITTYRDSAVATYASARSAYDANFLDYKAASRYSDIATIEKLLNETYGTAKLTAESVKSANDFLSFINDRLTDHHASVPALLAAHQTSLSGYTSKANTNLVNLLSNKNAIENDKNSITGGDRAIIEKQQSLAKLQAGSTALDIESATLAVTQRENALTDAKEKLADYYIRAPFDGTVAKVNVKRADSANTSVVVATLITRQKLAGISLNEVDAAKIKSGQKATLTFDAIDGLTITGEVAEIDTIGAVTQGVVTYAVKISFDTQDERVKSGMSVSAAVITDIKQDVLMVPNSAVKTNGTTHYVQMFDTQLPNVPGQQGAPSATPPREQPVEIGISNDTSTEITSGLNQGDRVVTRTITPTVTAAQQAPSLIGGGNTRIGGGGGGTRTPTGR